MAHPPFVAKAFGLEALSIGRHYIRNEQRERIGAHKIRGISSFKVKPSFHQSFTIWTVVVEGEVNAESDTPSWVKAGIEIEEQVAVASIEFNPIEQSLQSLNLYEYDGGITLDGVGYELSFETPSTRGVLCFSNPRTATLRSIERTMFNVAKAVLTSFPHGAAIETVGNWRSYVGETV